MIATELRKSIARSCSFCLNEVKGAGFCKECTNRKGQKTLFRIKPEIKRELETLEGKAGSPIEHCIAKCIFSFPSSFINGRNELILVPRWNVYFNLDDVETETQFKAKVIAFASRYCIKGVSDRWQTAILSRVNNFLETDFTKAQMEDIYTYFGNGIKMTKTIEFVERGYDMAVIEDLKGDA